MTKRHYREFFIYKKYAIPPMVYRIAGNVTNGGIAQQNAIVTLIDSDDDIVIGTKLSDASGNYSFDSGYPISQVRKYHVAVEYDSGAQKYNAKSMPFITPAEN